MSLSSKERLWHQRTKMASAKLDSAGVKKLLDNLQSDLKNISLETKKRHPAVKESAEEAIVKIRNASSAQTPLAYLSNQILYPLVQGCETKDTKVVTLCLQVIQRLITAQVGKPLQQSVLMSTGLGWQGSQICGRDNVDADGGWTRGSESHFAVTSLRGKCVFFLPSLTLNLQVRLLQTLTLLTTTNGVCQGDCLARCLVICFRLAFSKDGTVAGECPSGHQ